MSVNPKHWYDSTHEWRTVLDGIWTQAATALDALDYSEDSLLFGPAHIVWCDENFDRSSIDFCLKCCDEPQYQDRTPVEIEIVRWSLIKIIEILY